MHSGNVVQSAKIGGRLRLAVVVAAAAAAVSFFFVLHSYALNLLPYQWRIISPEEMRADDVQPSYFYYFSLPEGVPDRAREMRSRLEFSENDRRYTRRAATVGELRTVGGDWYAHPGAYVAFATIENSDPRTNGRVYRVGWPRLYSHRVAHASVVGLLVSLAALWAWCPRATDAPPVRARPRANAGRIAMGVVFLAGLYCNTGTLAPYAITFAPVHVDPATGFFYNQDHVHFRVLFDFVDGQPRSVWDGALLLRRIAYPLLAYPAMKLWGFEAGGVIFNLLANLAVFVGVHEWMRRRLGADAAWAGGWLLATYPGFAYWTGMPYPYALIAAGSLVLTIALHEIGGRRSWRHTLAWSAAMALLYLTYDFAPIFLPATLGLLLWQRRWAEAALAAVASVLPLAAWLAILRWGFHQSLQNSNSGVYGSVWNSFWSTLRGGGWLERLPQIADTGLTTFFGANFLFLPALFLVALLTCRWLSGARLVAAEIAVLASAAGLFLLVNFSAEGGGWTMSGSWIARLYQPVCGCLVFFLARWWQGRSAAGVWRPALASAMFAAAIVANCLVVWGPVANNPGRISSQAFFHFYTHSSTGSFSFYETNLATQPKRLLGFGRPLRKP